MAQCTKEPVIGMPQLGYRRRNKLKRKLLKFDNLLEQIGPRQSKGLIQFSCVKTKVSQEGTLLKKPLGLQESLETTMSLTL